MGHTEKNRMARNAKDYRQTKIYRLVCRKTNQQYIGHTAQTYLSKRKGNHVGDYKKYLAGKGAYCSSFKILEGNDFFIDLLETFPCANQDEARQRERHWQDQMECVNNYKAHISEEERQNRRKQKWADYYKTHKDELLASGRQYHQLHFEPSFGSSLRKLFYEEEEKQHDKKLSQERINNRRKERVICPCGVEVPRRHIKVHQRTMKHQTLLKKVI